jgi:hypothetical protein
VQKLINRAWQQNITQIAIAAEKKSRSTSDKKRKESGVVYTPHEDLVMSGDDDLVDGAAAASAEHRSKKPRLKQTRLRDVPTSSESEGEV